MKILLTNHHLLDYSGSEIFTLTLADFLTRKGHKVIVFSRYIDKMLKDFKKIDVQIVKDLEIIKKEKFDIAHVHHNINAIKVRHYFPRLPIIFLSHGIIPFLEQPPIMDLHISKYLAVSEEVKRNLIDNHKINAEKIEIFRNIVDVKRFFPLKKIKDHPQKALIISTRIDTEKEKIIRKTLESLNIKYKFIGGRFGWVTYDRLPNYLNQADIVFSLGRGAIEAMMSGTIPIVYDYLGGDGMVTPENIGEIMKNNFSGRRYHIDFTVKSLTQEIKKYKKENGEILKKMAVNYFGAQKRIKDMINIYKEFKSSKVLPISKDTKIRVNFIIKSIDETRLYDFENINRYMVRKYKKTSRIMAEKNNVQYGIKDLILLKIRKKISHFKEVFRKIVELDSIYLLFILITFFLDFLKIFSTIDPSNIFIY
jgi:glycosyltransferase involved in cell wall biosynthesis